MTSDHNTMIIEEFRATGGHPDGEWAGIPMILIHHHGARTGTERVTPLGCFPLGDGRFAVVASNGGSPAHPAWYHNLKARSRTTVEAGAETFPALAQELEAAARAELSPTLVAAHPTLASHQAKTTRQFPVLILTRERLPAARRRLPHNRGPQNQTEHRRAAIAALIADLPSQHETPTSEISSRRFSG